MRATKDIQDKMLEITSKQDALRDIERQQSGPLFAANSIHMSKEVFRKFTPALMNLLAYFISKSHLPVLLQILQVKINQGRQKFIWINEVQKEQQHINNNKYTQWNWN